MRTRKILATVLSILLTMLPVLAQAAIYNNTVTDAVTYRSVTFANLTVPCVAGHAVSGTCAPQTPFTTVSVTDGQIGGGVCMGGGTGALATLINGQWMCTIGATSGAGPFSPSMVTAAIAGQPITPSSVSPSKLDGTDTIGPFNGARSGEKNVQDFGAIPSHTMISIGATNGQNTFTGSLHNSDFLNSDNSGPANPQTNVVVYGAGPPASLATPTISYSAPVHIVNTTISGNKNTHIATGCVAANALSFCTAADNKCTTNNISFYENGQSLQFQGAGAAIPLAVSGSVVGSAGTCTATSASNLPGDIVTGVYTTVQGTSDANANSTWVVGPITVTGATTFTYACSYSSTANGGNASDILTKTIANLNDANQYLNFSSGTVTTTAYDAPIIGGNCTTARHYEVFAVDAYGGWSPPATAAVSNTSSALNETNYDMIQVTVPQPAGFTAAPGHFPPWTTPIGGGSALGTTIPLAWVFYCAEGGNPLQLCGVEPLIMSYDTLAGFSAPWNDDIIGQYGSSSDKTFPATVTFHDKGRWYGHDLIAGTAVPSSPPNENVYARLSGPNTITGATPAVSQTGTFTMAHDNGPNFSAAIAAACSGTASCGTVYLPYQQSGDDYPIASSVYAYSTTGLRIQGGAPPPITQEPSSESGGGVLWTGPIGGTALLLNSATEPTVENLTIRAGNSLVLGGGTTIGMAIDWDSYSTSGGSDGPVPCTRMHLFDNFVGEASRAVVIGNIQDGNCEEWLMQGGTYAANEGEGVYDAPPPAVNGLLQAAPRSRLTRRTHYRDWFRMRGSTGRLVYGWSSRGLISHRAYLAVSMALE